jgi:hypothetical protein
MFVRDEVRLEIGFTAAQIRLADLARGGWVLRASEGAYGGGTAERWALAAPGSLPAMSRLTTVHFRELTARRQSVGLALRWEAAGLDGGLFPALDADITLSPSGEHATTLTLVGVYRTKPGNSRKGLDQATARQAGRKTIRAFVDYMAAAMLSSPSGDRAIGPAPRCPLGLAAPQAAADAAGRS